MILPSSVTQYGRDVERAVGGTARRAPGTRRTAPRRTRRARSSPSARTAANVVAIGPSSASTARPLSANRPCGRFWMKTMMNTSTTIFASTAPDQGSRSLLAKPRPERRVHGAGELADAAEHHHHERVDDVAPGRGPGRRCRSARARSRRARRCPSPGRTPSVSTRAVGTPTQAAIARFCVTPRTNRPEPRRVSSSAHRDQHQQREGDDHDAAPRQHHVGQHLRCRPT